MLNSGNYWVDQNKDTLIPQTYTVTYKDYNGKVIKKEKVTSGDSLTLPSVTKRKGYSFRGWKYKDVNGYTSYWYDGCEVTSNLVLREEWIENSKIPAVKQIVLGYDVKICTYYDDDDYGAGGKTDYLPYAVIGGLGYNQPLTWTSSDYNVVTVNNGELSIHGYGTATVKVRTTDGKASAKCTVRVINPEMEYVPDIERISFPKSVNLKVGEQKVISPKIYPAGAGGYDEMQWIVDSNSLQIETIGDKCVIKGLKKGIYTMIVCYFGFDGYEYSSVKINVGNVSDCQPGDYVSKGNLRYRITSKTMKGGTVTVCGLSKTAAKNKKLTSLVIPSKVKIEGRYYKVTAIRAKAFYGNQRLKKVTVGKYVKKVGAKAFGKCKKLKKILYK